MTAHDTTDPVDQLGRMGLDLQAELERDFPAARLKHSYSTPNSSANPKGYEPPAMTRHPSGGHVERPPQNFSGPPDTPQISGPLALLNAVTQNAHELHREVRELAAALTGEKVVERLPSYGAPGGKAVGLLPSVARSATEIDVVLSEIARIVEHLRRAI